MVGHTGGEGGRQDLHPVPSVRLSSEVLYNRTSLYTQSEHVPELSGWGPAGGREGHQKNQVRAKSE